MREMLGPPRRIQKRPKTKAAFMLAMSPQGIHLHSLLWPTTLLTKWMGVDRVEKVAMTQLRQLASESDFPGSSFLGMTPRPFLACKIVG